MDVTAFNEDLSEYRKDAYLFFRRIASLGKKFLLRSEILDEFNAFCEENEISESLKTSGFAEVITKTQDAAVSSPWLYLSVRPRTARWTYLRIHIEEVVAAEITASEILSCKENLVSGIKSSSEFALEIDLAPFNRGFPSLQESRSIGKGVEFLNRKLSSTLFHEIDEAARLLLRFLRVHQCQGKQLMLNGRIKTIAELRYSLRAAEEYLSSQPRNAMWGNVEIKMHELGFEPGWGNTAELMLETINLLSDILEAPEPKTLETFLGRIPMIFSILILSPHGYFGQANNLGLPDTGGQVVYILDQVKALEKEMLRRIHAQGLDIMPQIVIVSRLIPEAGETTCNERLEHVVGTQNVKILRVPFRNEAGDVVPHWISRFEIWPYLERFTLEVEKEVLAEMTRKPDLIVGNYSDGNLVASLLSSRMKVTQCNIAHALEKVKYLYSDLYWMDNEERYHFSSQFTADLISMNTADFIITSTYQEIAGTEESVGQYEGYSAFTMPELYRVVHGVNLFDPKFNIVSPGADEEVYFPHTLTEQRLTNLEGELRELIYGDEPVPRIRGRLENKEKPLIFTMARLDRIKNLTGLLSWYARSERLREKANLVIVGGYIDAGESSDNEEQEQIHLMHELFNNHGLDGQVRWLGQRLEKNLSGELYRYIADQRGIFVQPALFEAFGLTVIEAMISGLPTFATCFGGPLEIIKDGVSGFHIDPNKGEEAAEILADFFERCKADPDYWSEISQGGIDRVKSRYTWSIYAERMMTLSRIYGFWKYVTNLERDENRRYLEMIYSLMFRPLAERVPHQ